MSNVKFTCRIFRFLQKSCFYRICPCSAPFFNLC